MQQQPLPQVPIQPPTRLEQLRLILSGDGTAEADETFEVTISSPMNATLGDPDTATGTILSDDVPALSIESVSVDENIGTANVRVSLASPGATAISVSVYHFRWDCSSRF